MKALRSIAVVFLMMLSMLARAEFREEVSAGQCKYHTREAGTWYIDGQETANSLITGCYQVGLHWQPEQISKNKAGLRFSWVDLGQFHGRNVAFIDDLDVGSTPNCNNQTGRGCLSKYDVNGGAKGISLAMTGERKFGPVVLGAELGGLLYKGWSDTQVTRLCELPCGNDPRGLNFTYNQADGIQKSWLAGLNLRYDWFTISYRYYHNIYEQGRGYGGDVGLTGGRVWQVLAGISVPL